MAKYLDFEGVKTLWNKVKELVTEKVGEGVVDKLGAANGIATLGEDAKLNSSQLPSLKTINGTSIVGDGNVEIDLSLYKIVDSLPTENIEENKIYLVVDTNDIEGNVYDEFVYANNKWEKLGSYRASVELANVVKDDQFITSEELASIFAGTEEPSEEEEPSNEGEQESE